MSFFQKRFDNKALIGTNGITSENIVSELMVGPQPLPPGRANAGIINNAGIIKTMSLPTNPPNNGLTSRIVLGQDYYEQYWKYNGNDPIYLLMISPRYDVVSKAMASYTNGTRTYTHPAMFIPLKEKHLYAPLWEKTVNSGYQFDTDPNGFVARST